MVWGQSELDAQPMMDRPSVQLELAQDPRARQERISIRRARILARIAARRLKGGSSDEDAPDADLPFDHAAIGIGKSRSRSKSRTTRKKSHHHGHSHHHPHHGHSHATHHGHPEEEAPQLTQAITPAGKKIFVKPVEIEPIRTIDEKLEVHVEKSKKLLEQLLLDAETFVTNVKVAAEYRERTRHDKQETSKKFRLENEEKEADECELMYDTVASNWFTSAKGLLPLELYQMIQEQQKSCENLLDKKQDLIDSLKSEIESNDVEYESDLQKQQKDLMLMGDRIDDQVEIMRLAFMTELDLLEEYTCKDRETMLENNEKEYAVLMEELDKSEIGTLDAMHAATMDRFNSISDMYTQSREETRRIKIQLENDMRTLQLEAEQIKIAAILNAEKLEYNLEILRRRENENLRMISGMKRLVLHLQDRFNDKAKALKDIVDVAKRENSLLIQQIRRLEYLNKDAMHKALHEVATAYRKYMDLWKMNEDDAREKLSRLIGTEKFIFENYLDLSVEDVNFEILDDRPDEVQYFFMRQIEAFRPTRTKHSSVKAGKSEDMGGRSLGSIPEDENEDAKSVDEYNMQKNQDLSNDSLFIEPTKSIEFLPGPAPDPAVQRRLMKHITKVICDQTGFIIEEKLRKILAPMIRTEQTLIHIDVVLQALGVTNLSEMQILARYLLRESKVMRGLMSKMGTAITPDISSMRLSATGLPANQEDDDEILVKLMPKVGKTAGGPPDSDMEEQVDPRKYLVTFSTSTFNIIPSSEVKVPRLKAAEEVIEGNVDQAATATAALKSDRVPKPESSDGGVLTPVSQESSPSPDEQNKSVSGEYLVKLPTLAERNQSDEGADEGILIQTEFEGMDYTDSDSETCSTNSLCTCDSDGIVRRKDESVNTRNATILSKPRPKTAATDVMVLFTGNQGIGSMESNLQYHLIRSSDQDGRPITDSAGDGGRSQTISIPSLVTTSAGSEEFLYIEPNDVLRALAEFCKDYNAKIKIEMPTEEELIDAKLAKLKFPDDIFVNEYWARFWILLDPKSHDLWEAILKCFSYYATILEERNQMIRDIERLYHENLELGYLLKKKYRGHCNGLNYSQFSPSGLPYCDC